MSALADLRELAERRAIIWHFVGAQLKSGHRDKVLGNLWHLIDPLSYMLVFYVIWSIVLGTRGPDFMAYLLSGIIAFRFFQESAISASTVMRGQARLIREIYFPKSVLPTAVTVARLYDFAWAVGALLLLLAYLLYTQAHLSVEQAARITHPLSFGVNALWVPVIVGILFMFSLGAAYLFAIIGAVFRDTPNILGFAFRIWFYLSPLFYYPEDVPRRVWLFYRLNPFTHFFRLLRATLIYDTPPTLDGMLYVTGLSVATLVIGFIVFARYEGIVIKQL